MPEEPIPANANSKQLLKNVAANYLSLAFAIVFSFLFTRFALHDLGTTIYGVWIVLGSVVGYFGLLDLGVSTAATTAISQHVAQKQFTELSRVVATVTVFFIGSGLLVLATTVILSPFIASLLGVTGAAADTVRLAMIMMGVTKAFQFTSLRTHVVIFGSGRGDWIALLATAIGLFTQTTQILVIFFGGRLLGLAIVSAGGGLLGIGSFIILARRIPGYTQWHWINGFSRSTLSELVRSGARNASVAITGTISYGLDALIIGLMLPVRLVSPYDVALSTANLGRSISTYGTNQLLPTYAHSNALDDRERQFKLFSFAVLISMAVTIPIAIALVAYGPSLLHLWLGHVPPRTFEVLVALNVVFILQLPGHQSFIYLTGSGQNHQLIRLGVTGAVVNLAGTVFATHMWGPIGPAIGSLPQVIVLDFFVLPRLVCRLINVPWHRYFRASILPLAPLVGSSVLIAIITRICLQTRSSSLNAVEALALVLLTWCIFGVVLSRSDPEYARQLRRLTRWVRPRRDGDTPL